jgi:hypothetical protein
VGKIGRVRSRIVSLMTIASLAGCAAGIEQGHRGAPLTVRAGESRKLPVGVLELRGLEPQAPVGHPEQYATTFFVEAAR